MKQSKPLICVLCGHPGTRPDARFCGKCGAKLVRFQREHGLWSNIGIRVLVGLICSVIFYLFYPQVFNWNRRIAPTQPHEASPAASPTAPPAEEVSTTAPAELDVELKTATEGFDSPFFSLYITSKDAEQVTIKRIVINNRVGVEGCDLKTDPNPDLLGDLRGLARLAGVTGWKLNTGDRTAVMVTRFGCGAKVVMVDIYTDRGSDGRRYTFSGEGE